MALNGKPVGYSVLLGKALVEVLTYLTVSPLLCGDVETCGLGAEMQLLMSGQRRHLRGSGRPAPPLGA